MCIGNRIFGLLIFGIFLGWMPSISDALVITSPKDGEVVKEGDTVTMVAELSPNDPTILWVNFFVTEGSRQCDRLFTHPRYECRLTIRPGGSSEIKIQAVAPTPVTGEVVESQIVKLFVTLPPTVTLQGLKSFGGDRMFFSEIDENEQLYIEGIYSDGVDRELWLAQTGTIYSSSDEEVVAVDKDGLVSAKSTGIARITVKNGEHELTIKAKVDSSSNKKKK